MFRSAHKSLNLTNIELIGNTRTKTHEEKRKMRFVISGASGFLGQAVTQLLATYEGIEVVPVSRSGRASTITVTDYLNTPEGDVLIHLAQTSDRARVNELEYGCYNSECELFLELCSRGYKHLLYVSTATLYGDANLAPSFESDPLVLKDAYTRLKFASERICLEHGGTVARMTNVYGVGMAKNTVLSTIIGQLQRNQEVRVKSLYSVRDFLWIDDAASALCQLATGGSNTTYNVGTGRATSIEQLVRSASSITGRKMREPEETSLGEDRSYLVLDPTKIKKHIGWEAQVDIEEGLSKLLTV